MKMVGEVKVSLVTAVCVLTLAIVSKYFIQTELDFVSQYGPVWIFIAYILTKDRTKRQRVCSSWLFWVLAEVVGTAAILVVYGL